ncbi:MAG: hypothetical protein WC705_00175 [Candidatus Paceibacterota bacterium]|jgi:hypothetical protein
MFKKMLVLMMLVLAIPATVSAQSADASIYIKMSNGGGGPQIIPWFTYDSGFVFLETRANFDWKDALTFYVGKSFKIGSTTTVIPEAGVIWGELYKSYTPQVLAFGGNEKVGWVTLNQLSFGFNDESPDFAYHWAECLWKAKPYLSVGGGEQVYWEYGTNGSDAQVDIGPVIKFHFSHGFYAKLWGTTDPNNSSTRKLFIGLGNSF